MTYPQGKIKIMNVLLVGGSGHVGTMTLPYMKPITIFESLTRIRPKIHPLITSKAPLPTLSIVQEALKGMDTFVYMVMLQPTSDRSSVADFSDIVANYEVNAKGLHIVLHAARKQAFDTPSTRVPSLCHERTRNNFPYEDVVPRDNPGVYGLTKGFGEQDSANTSHGEHGMSLIRTADHGSLYP